MNKEIEMKIIKELPDNIDEHEPAEILYLKYRAIQGVEDIKNNNYISSTKLKKVIQEWK